MSAPTPASSPPGDRPPGRRSRRRVLVVVLASVLAVGLVCCGGVSFALYRHFDDPAKSPASAVDRFLSEVESGGAADSDALCRSRRDDAESLSQKVFTAAQLSREQVSDLRWVTAQPKIGPDDAAEVAVDVSYVLEADGASRQVQQLEFTFIVVDERGWKVCDIES